MDEYEGLGRRIYNGVMFARALQEILTPYKILGDQFFKEHNLTHEDIKKMKPEEKAELNKKWRERCKENGLLPDLDKEKDEPK
jgi:hypothetical protein